MLQVHHDVLCDTIFVCVFALFAQQYSVSVNNPAASTVEEVRSQRNVHFVVREHVGVVAHKLPVVVLDVLALCCVQRRFVEVPVQVHALLAREVFVGGVAPAACALVYPLGYVGAVHGEPVHVHPGCPSLRSSNKRRLDLLRLPPTSSGHGHGQHGGEDKHHHRSPQRKSVFHLLKKKGIQLIRLFF